MIHSWCCTFDGFGQRYKVLYKRLSSSSSIHHYSITQSIFTFLKFCVVPTHPSTHPPLETTGLLSVQFSLFQKDQKCFPSGSDGKASVCNAGDTGSIPGSGRYPGEGNGNPLQYSCLENPMDRGAWWATAHGVAKSQT